MSNNTFITPAMLADMSSIQSNIVKDNVTLAPTELEFLRTNYAIWCQKCKGDYRPCLFGEDGRKIRDHMIDRQRLTVYGLAMGEEWCVNGTRDNPRFNFVYDEEDEWINPNDTEDGEEPSLSLLSWRELKKKAKEVGVSVDDIENATDLEGVHRVNHIIKCIQEKSFHAKHI